MASDDRVTDALAALVALEARQEALARERDEALQLRVTYEGLTGTIIEDKGFEVIVRWDNGKLGAVPAHESLARLHEGGGR